MTCSGLPRVAVAGLVVLLSVAAPFAPARAATQFEIDNAIRRGQAFLLKAQSVPGRWETDAQRRGEDHNWQNMQGINWGGYTAVATYALLATGMSPQHPDVAAAIKFLKTADIIGPYAVAMRAQVWTYLPQTAETQALFKQDLALLLRTLNTQGRASGLWDYKDLGPSGDTIDHSVSQFGVLGLWSAAQGGLAINPKLWEVMDQAWKANQFPDGGWSYDTDGKSGAPTASMTAAGIATLFITLENVPSAQGLNCEGNPTAEALERGLQWMNANFHTVKNNVYLWYGIERIGAASGRKHFGGRDWYAIGAEDVVRRQKSDGSWVTDYPGAAPINDTAFALLFLSRGRAPVLVNKLNHGAAEAAVGVAPQEGAGPRTPGSVAPVPAAPRAPGAVAPAPSPAPAPVAAPATGPATGPATAPTTAPFADWNQRPRDVSNMTRWIGRQSERYLHWQVLDLKAEHRHLMEAPVLYISGSTALEVDDEGVAKLRRFVEEGGLILGNADCGKEAFGRSFRALGKRMFPKYAFRVLPPTHPILSGQGFRADRWKERVNVEGLGNGSRELMLLIPTADPARAWQEGAVRSREHHFQLASNVFYYATDKRIDRIKGDTHLVADRGVAPQRRVSVARLVTGGNWDPEPAGWRRLETVLKNDYALGLIVEPVRLGAGRLSPSVTPMAHLTGTDAFKLEPAQRAELRKFVEGGGTLVVDAAGGSAPFADAAERELGETFGEEAALQLKSTLPADHPVYVSPGAPIQKVTYRRYAMQRIVGELKSPRLRGITVNDRLAVIFSREDLSTGLVGHAVDGIVGYDPATATALMRSVILHGTGLNLKPLRPDIGDGLGGGGPPAGDGLE